MVWYHGSLQSVSVLLGLLVMVIQAVYGPGDFLGYSCLAKLRLNGVDLGELFDFGVLRL